MRNDWRWQKRYSMEFTDRLRGRFSRFSEIIQAIQTHIIRGNSINPAIAGAKVNGSDLETEVQMLVKWRVCWANNAQTVPLCTSTWNMKNSRRADNNNHWYYTHNMHFSHITSDNKQQQRAGAAAATMSSTTASLTRSIYDAKLHLTSSWINWRYIICF